MNPKPHALVCDICGTERHRIRDVASAPPWELWPRRSAACDARPAPTTPAASAARAAEPAARPTAAPARVARRRLRFATFNIQSKSIVFSKTHVWDNRINALVHTLRELKLDVVCFQEPLASQLDELRKLVGDEFEILNGETVWAANRVGDVCLRAGRGRGEEGPRHAQRDHVPTLAPLRDGYRAHGVDHARRARVRGPNQFICRVHARPGRRRRRRTLAFVGDERPSLVAASTHLYYRRETPVTSGEDSPPARLLAPRRGRAQTACPRAGG